MADKHGRTMSEEFGIRVDPVKADEADGSGQYLTKVGYELAMADIKIGRDEGHRTRSRSCMTPPRPATWPTSP